MPSTVIYQPGSAVRDVQVGATAASTAAVTTILAHTVTPPAAPVAGEVWNIEIDYTIVNNTGAARTFNTVFKYGATSLTLAPSGSIAASASARRAHQRLQVIFVTLAAGSGQIDVSVQVLTGGAPGSNPDSLQASTSFIGKVTGSSFTTTVAAAMDIAVQMSNADFTITPDRIVFTRQLP